MIKHKADTLLPPKTHLNMPDGVFCNVMPSLLYLPNGNWGGVKMVTRYPKREPALDSKIVLFNSDTGDFLAILDGNWITAMRTGAVAAHSIITYIKVVIALRSHPFPFRTGSLSSASPMVLHCVVGE